MGSPERFDDDDSSYTQKQRDLFSELFELPMTVQVGNQLDILLPLIVTTVQPMAGGVKYHRRVTSGMALTSIYLISLN